jgi:RecB family exonuclease
MARAPVKAPTKATTPTKATKPTAATKPSTKSVAKAGTSLTKPRPVEKPRFTSWSFSRYNDYQKCPFAAKCKHLDKVKEPSSPAMERGSRIGKLGEDYIKGVVRTLPKELAAFEDDFKAMRTQYAAARKAAKSKGLPIFVEDNWAFTKDWTTTQWNDWVGCWVRIKLDVGHFLEEDLFLVTDWKTGKFRPEKNAEYMEQIELYILAALLTYYDRPNLRVKARLCYLDTGDVYPGPQDPSYDVEYTQADVPRLKKQWEQRTKKMFADTTFRPKPGNGCRWCFYGQAGKAKGGPGKCKF